MNHDDKRRSLVTGLGAATAAAAAAAFVPGTLRAQTRAGGFQPTRHSLDSWLGEFAGQHRIFIDSATATGGAEALLYANNLYTANQGAYDLDPADLAMVVCLRHFSTPFAYSDAVWEKYGKVFSNVMQFVDPNTGIAPSSNLMNSTDAYGFALPNVGNTIDSLLERGTQFAVCNAATQFFAGQVSQAAGIGSDEAYDELVASAIPNSRFVSAGVVAVTRAQEYGYSLLYAG